MPHEPPTHPKANGLVIRPSTGLIGPPVGSFPALSEIISRSIAHIQTSRALAVSIRQPGEEREFEIAPGVMMVMCWIPPGEYLMGSPEDEVDRIDHETQHPVMITQGFWLAKTQTTQAQWQVVMGSNPSHFKDGDLPVEQVSWDDICGKSGTGGFLRELNKGSPMGGHFHLPTEAQWEYACRAGTMGPYYGDLDAIAWYDENSDGKTHPVGQKKPNIWGLQDMHGNVSEWCADWWGRYDLREVTDPVGPASASIRVGRGGSFLSKARSCRIARRLGGNPSISSSRAIGFRIARSSVP